MNAESLAIVSNLGQIVRSANRHQIDDSSKYQS
nr:MAG TPA: hypothetical protein [Caudoviricetes sp.]DAX48552.1 MAG TPA: hypothetical protein [Caudoviricetes sp.]